MIPRYLVKTEPHYRFPHVTVVTVTDLATGRVATCDVDDAHGPDGIERAFGALTEALGDR